MKKTNLALAILLSLGVAACGSSSDDSKPAKPEMTQAQKQAEAAKKAAEEAKKAAEEKLAKQTKMIDPLGIGHVTVDNLALNSSVGTQLSVRGAKSNYNKKLKEFAGVNGNDLASVIFSNTLNDGKRKDLENIQVAVEVTNKYHKDEDGKVVNTEKLSTGYRYAGKLEDTEETLQAANVRNKSRYDDLYTGNNEAKLENNYKTNTSEIRMFGKNRFIVEVKGNEETTNSYSGAKLVNGKLVETPMLLEYVQYGRVTNNIDPITSLVDHTTQAVFLEKKDPKAVDTYFARGVGQTSVKDMDKVLAGKRDLTYVGHAVTRGLDHATADETTTTQAASNGGYDNVLVKKTPATSVTKPGQVLGSFVKANVDLSEKKVSGKVYDVIVKPSTAKMDEVSLVNFKDAEIIGNTFFGEQVTADKAKEGLSKKGTIKGQFFGTAADEMAGSITSVQGKSDAKSWSVVFGAKKVPGPKPSTEIATGNITSAEQPRN